MIKCEVIESFTLEKFNELKNVQKVANRKDNEFGVKDTFECDKEMADYLLGNNILKKVVVKVIEVVPENDMPKENIEKGNKIISDGLKEMIFGETILKEKTKKKKTKK